MPHSPPRTEPRGFGAAALASHERGHRRKMIRFKRVSHPKQRAQTRDCGEADHRDDRYFARQVPARGMQQPVRRHRARQPDEQPGCLGRG
jgi:hypothetical protein